MPVIALVDDDRNILTSVSMALEAEGYQTQSYTDGVAALQAVHGAFGLGGAAVHKAEGTEA